MSKISEANRRAKGNITGLRQSPLNQARVALGIIPKPGSPTPAPKISKPKGKPKTITIAANKPKGVSAAAWAIIKSRAK